MKTNRYLDAYINLRAREGSGRRDAVDVTVKRWEDYTGRKAELAE